MKLFKGTACFSPSVPSALKEAWTEHGGTLARTTKEKQYSDWFFCIGMGDPWMCELSKRPIVVFHANWIQAVVSSKFPIPLAGFVLDERFGPLDKTEPPFARRFRKEASESSDSAFSPAENDSNTITATSEIQSLIKLQSSKSPEHPGSQYHSSGPANHGRKALEQVIPEHHNDEQLSWVNQDQHMIQSPIYDQLDPDAYAVGSAISNSAGQAQEIYPSSFSIEFPRDTDHLAIYPEKTAANQDRILFHSSFRVTLPSNIWLSLGAISSSSDGSRIISISDTRDALSGIPIDKMAFFIPPQSHLGREFRYIGVDRRRTI